MSSGTLLSLSPQKWCYRCALPTEEQLLCGCRGSELRTTSMHSKHLIIWANSLIPQLCGCNFPKHLTEHWVNIFKNSILLYLTYTCFTVYWSNKMSDVSCRPNDSPKITSPWALRGKQVTLFHWLWPQLKYWIQFCLYNSQLEVNKVVSCQEFMINEKIFKLSLII